MSLRINSRGHKCFVVVVFLMKNPDWKKKSTFPSRLQLLWSNSVYFMNFLSAYFSSCPCPDCIAIVICIRIFERSCHFSEVTWQALCTRGDRHRQTIFLPGTLHHCEFYHRVASGWLDKNYSPQNVISLRRASSDWRPTNNVWMSMSMSIRFFWHY